MLATIWVMVGIAGVVYYVSNMTKQNLEDQVSQAQQNENMLQKIITEKHLSNSSLETTKMGTNGSGSK